MIDTIQFYPGLGNSDHVCLMFNNLSCYTPVSDDTMQFRYNLRRADFEKLHCLIDARNWNGELTNLDVNQQWSYLSNILINCLNGSIPLCKPRAHQNIYIPHEAIRMKKNYGNAICLVDHLLIEMLFGMPETPFDHILED